MTTMKELIVRQERLAANIAILKVKTDKLAEEWKQSEKETEKLQKKFNEFKASFHKDTTKGEQ
jgi:hypothetical protein